MNRIEWIDTAKGIAILLVVLEHTTSISASNYLGVILTNIRMPLYFVLSGLFFKTYNSGIVFFEKKINNLIIPTLFFFWGACLVYYLLSIVGVKFEIPFQWSYALDIFRPTEEIYCNGVVWFLIALFWLNGIFYILSIILKNKLYLTVIIGWLFTIYSQGGELPYFIDTSITAMPFFYCGILLKRMHLLEEWKYDRYLPWIVITGLVFVTLFAESNSMRSNRYDNPYLFHLTAMCGVLALLALCKKIGRVPMLSSMYGRYSLIVLGTHGLLINPIRRFSIMYIDGSGLFTFTMVILAELAVIPLFVKLFPYFCAQKSILNLLSRYTLKQK